MTWLDSSQKSDWLAYDDDDDALPVVPTTPFCSLSEFLYIECVCAVLNNNKLIIKYIIRVGWSILQYNIWLHIEIDGNSKCFSGYVVKFWSI